MFLLKVHIFIEESAELHLREGPEYGKTAEKRKIRKKPSTYRILTHDLLVIRLYRSATGAVLSVS